MTSVIRMEADFSCHINSSIISTVNSEEEYIDHDTDSDNDDETQPLTNINTSRTMTRTMTMRTKMNRMKVSAKTLLGMVLITVTVVSFCSESTSPWTMLTLGNRDKTIRDVVMVQGDIIIKQDYDAAMVPSELLQYGIYKTSDFVNERGIGPPFWEANNSNGSWGPCYPEENPVKWKPERLSSEDELVYKAGAYNKMPRHRSYNSQPQSVGGHCRPGFIIIGTEKCGTSSLYHYLVGHPRVVPAYQKQVNYFVKMSDSRNMRWYYGFFPTTKTFLQSGALMTGEASPLYAEHPDAARQIRQNLPGTKIIMVGRNPLRRVISSYHYSYVQPALNYLRFNRRSRSANRTYEKSLTDEEIDAKNMDRLFSLEDFVRSELKQLRKCLEGFGINATRKIWYERNWTKAEFDRRDAEGLDPLVEIIAVCYETSEVNSTVLREQWAEMQMANPHKYILPIEAYHAQALIGRSLYAFQLEWYYIVFAPEDIIFLCTEDMNKPDALNEVALQLGLPSHDFSSIIAQGVYNVGDHRGYDEATSWQKLREENSNINENATIVSTPLVSDDEIPLSRELRQELEEFIRPYNERLFQLVGKRCDW